MTSDWEDVFRSWSKPSSYIENQKCKNAERMIRGAIKKNDVLSERKIEIFSQGSYRNNTNVRQDSDVDICVRCMDMFYTNFSTAEGFNENDVDLKKTSYTYTQFKDEVEQALVAKFGRNSVTRGNKAFDIHANSYRVDADVVACFEHRRYTHCDYDGHYKYLSGTEFLTDNGKRIVNWPHQNYENGVKKNRDTSNRYKLITRILKGLRNEMSEKSFDSAKLIPSYLIECLAWNAPNEAFNHDSYTADVRYVLAHLFNNTIKLEDCIAWGEVNELKYLFYSEQPWTWEQAHAFLDASWNYIGFE